MVSVFHETIIAERPMKMVRSFEDQKAQIPIGIMYPKIFNHLPSVSPVDVALWDYTFLMAFPILILARMAVRNYKQ